ncbi:MerR family transcriptional regulator [Levilactobacillus tujiorum]|uniref:MerR family transcriptional regulator n=1 Tax=Levilactobacillus tujiorum TaxID=2912243 RepID=A0ABX1L3F6_9LACO|nr:MerR family transcriptional regulator [Levilactobacillus tujiorum]MCH5464581.1 MerR family transcriptional regulator [Levilactobacillus tujiorum]NLR12840.1 MerR family transcriptional regulator [Lactobacillus sp. HBUAS51387]NLR29561.1 MerR family transcriptional regulator [Levilactobacillus tujiorum]NLR31278.1 MerR family transcriptional regulator [Levilactobacillus tujiorum]
MKEKELRRSMAVLPMGTVMKLTSLTARQIRYYEAQGLISPERSDGNRRLYSLNDIDRLLEIRDYLADGVNVAGIKAIYDQQRVAAQAKREAQRQPLTDEDVRRILQDEFIRQGGLGHPEPGLQQRPL